MSRKKQQKILNKGAVALKLSSNNCKVLNLLRSGEYTAMEIVEKLKLPDPRSNIRNLRNAGYLISDYVITIEDTRRKKYFLKHNYD